MTDGNPKADELDTGGVYEPVVRLPIIVVSDGEEKENVVYKQKATLHRFDVVANEWKERGKGDVRFLQHKSTKKVRVLLRQDKTLKIRLNHYVTPLMELKENAGSDRAWTWVANDFADEESSVSSFAIRFKDSKIASYFKTMFNMARRINGGDTEIEFPVLVDAGEQETEIKTSASSTSCDRPAVTSSSASSSSASQLEEKSSDSIASCASSTRSVVASFTHEESDNMLAQDILVSTSRSLLPSELTSQLYAPPPTLSNTSSTSSIPSSSPPPSFGATNIPSSSSTSVTIVATA